MEFVTLIGTLAVAASTISFVPQAWNIIKQRRTRDISIGTYSLTVTGFGLWLTYGILRGEWPLIVPNVLCLAISAFILVMSLLPQREKDAVADVLDPAIEASHRKTGPQ